MSERAANCTSSGVPLVEEGSTSFLVQDVMKWLWVEAQGAEIKEFYTFVLPVDTKDPEVI